MSNIHTVALLLATVRLAAQTTDALRFEVASIKPSEPDSVGMRLNVAPGGGLNCNGVTLKALISFAYDVQDFQLSGGPSWMNSERFQIIARPDHPDGPGDLRQAGDEQRKTTLERVRIRTQALLADRFQVAVHRDVADHPVYLLSLGKNGHKMKTSTETGGITRDRGFLKGEGATMEMFAHVLGFTLGRPVLDRTGLSGKFDFRLAFAEDGQTFKDKPGAPPAELTSADVNGPSIFSAIQEQLGLKLEGGKGPVPVIVIDRAEKPSAN